jgi:hypothetical protein
MDAKDVAPSNKAKPAKSTAGAIKYTPVDPSRVNFGGPSSTKDTSTYGKSSPNGKVNFSGPMVAEPQRNCTQAQLWALACPALLTLNNGHRHDLLWCIAPTPQNIAAEKKALSEWWDINSREDLLKQLTWIINSGHRTEFDQMNQVATSGAAAAIRAKLSPSDVRDFDERLKIVQDYGASFGIKSLLGWDYCRYIGLCRWGTLCGYLTPDEAWTKIMPVAQLLQNSFSSWSDLGTNYLVGRHFWQPHSNLQPSFEKNYQLLLSDPKSPWVTIAWNTKLK